MNEDGIQMMINGYSAQWQKDRSKTQMTLGTMIKYLESLNQDSFIQGMSNPHSYRGYYCDLAFEPQSEGTKVSDALQMCRSCMGEIFEGYKGGEYVMGALTPVWISCYGSCGKKLITINPDGTFTTEEDE